MNTEDSSISLQISCLRYYNISGGTRELEEQLKKPGVRSHVSTAVFSQRGFMCKARLDQSANDKCDGFSEARGVGKFAESLYRGLIFEHETPYILVSLVTTAFHNWFSDPSLEIYGAFKVYLRNTLFFHLFVFVHARRSFLFC